MSFYFREKPRFGDKLRGKSRDELMQEFKQQFDDNDSFFEPNTTTRVTRAAPFERHTGFSRGFPFDDVEGFGRRGSDIRSHLDDLASRHPEFADHLLGSAWGDIPAFHNTGSLRNRRRRRGSGSSSSYQGHPDEDTRSQTSGSSATSAASGASGVSSNGEPSTNNRNNVYSSENQESTPLKQENTQNTRRNPIPQYGTRNTVDIGQHRHDMDDNNDRTTNDNRGQRSASAPPENRQQNQSEQPSQQQNPQNSNQRYVSRVDITPQFGQPVAAASNEKSGAKPMTNQQQKIPQQQGNVRHIPIFVEGRDEPVVPKNLDNDQTDGGTTWNYAKPPTRTDSPPHFQPNTHFPTPPQFHRPSHFNQHYTGGRARDWLPNFDEEFYAPQAPAAGSSFQQPGMRKQQQQPTFTSHSPPRQGQHFRQPQQKTETAARSRQNNENPLFNQQSHSSTSPQQQQRQQDIPTEEPRKQTQPKDPLEKVADVQKEVNSLNEQVILWNGKSRKDKDYMYLDEMLTRELIKLDDIETEGKENVRQARKNAIKSITDSISLLESKAPLNDERSSESRGNMEIQQQPDTTEILNNSERTESTMINEDKIDDSNDKTRENEQQIPIPLPAAPSSPIKESVSTLPKLEDRTIEKSLADNESAALTEPCSASQQRDNDNVGMDVTTPVSKVSSTGSMDIQAIPETEQPKMAMETTAVIVPETLMEVENPKSPKTMKKVRKTKKQQQPQAPIFDGAIPLPAPESH